MNIIFLIDNSKFSNIIFDQIKKNMKKHKNIFSDFISLSLVCRSMKEILDKNNLTIYSFLKEKQYIDLLLTKNKNPNIYSHLLKKSINHQEVEKRFLNLLNKDQNFLRKTTRILIKSKLSRIQFFIYSYFIQYYAFSYYNMKYLNNDRNCFYVSSDRMKIKLIDSYKIDINFNCFIRDKLDVLFLKYFVNERFFIDEMLFNQKIYIFPDILSNK